jgi:hypothetical protein
VPDVFSALNFEGMFEVGATITFLGKTRIFPIFLTLVPVFDKNQKFISILNWLIRI